MSTIQLDTFHNLSCFHNVLHFQTQRYGGLSTGYYDSLNIGFSTGDQWDRVLSNRLLLSNKINIPLSKFVFSHQIHSSNIHIVTAKDSGKGIYGQDCIPEADAMITCEKNIVMCVKTADCIPIFCYEPRRQIIAIIHAGWKGTSQNITRKTVELMRDNFGCQICNIHAGIGAGAGMCCYNVQEDVFQALKKTVSSSLSETYYKNIDSENYYIDLKQINRLHLIEAGVPMSQIEINSKCSICNDNYFSFRANPGQKVGQMCAGIVML